MMMAFSSKGLKTGNTVRKPNHLSEEVKVNGVTIKFKLDTGADVTVIKDSTYTRFFHKN